MAPERVVLPTNVTPTHYNLKLVPNLETFVFTGEVAIKYGNKPYNYASVTVDGEGGNIECQRN